VNHHGELNDVTRPYDIIMCLKLNILEWKLREIVASVLSGAYRKVYKVSR